VQRRCFVGRRSRVVPTSDDLVLTGAQERFIWRRVVTQNASKTPSGAALYGEAVPASVTLHALPANVTGQIPMLKPYAYAILGKTLLIVNPADRKVVDIITP
jgi:Protein of unknown function (DUF1236)